jgi:hypothetical protein
MWWELHGVTNHNHSPDSVDSGSNRVWFHQRRGLVKNERFEGEARHDGGRLRDPFLRACTHQPFVDRSDGGGCAKHDAGG